MTTEEKYIMACYGTIADQTVLMRAPDGFKMRVDRRDVPQYLELGWVRA